jgi:hypothetical protein
MHAWVRRLSLGLVSALLVLAGCSNKAAEVPANAARIYVLTGASERLAKLQVLSGSGDKTLSTTLKQAGASALARGPDGRLWVGGRTVSGLPLTSITVVDADLAQQTRVPTPGNPGVGMVFSEGKLLVAASQRGFGGAVTEVDPTTLATRTLEVPPPEGKSYILTALAATDRKIVVAGMTNGPDPAKRYAIITVIDRPTLHVVWRSEALEHTDVWRILPYQDGFVLLNVASAEDPRSPRTDALVLGADHRLTPLSFHAAPLWGAIQGDVLTTFHNASWNSLRNVQTRHVSTYNLTTKSGHTFELPQGMDAQDLVAGDGRVLLSVKSTADAHPSGLYVLAPDARALDLVAPLPDPGKLIWQAAGGQR